LKEGKLSFVLHGDKLRGEFSLIRMKGRDKQWLLIKSDDEFAKPGWTLKLRLNNGAAGGKAAKTRKKPQSARPRPVKKMKKTSHESEQGSQTIPASRAFEAKELSGDVNLRVGKDVVALTHLDKMYWPDDGYTKGDLVKYYYEVAKYILPYLKDRPLILKRYPNGIDKPAFHQHNVEDAPEYARTVTVDVEEGHKVGYLVCDNLATLLYVTNLGAIERHPWNSRVPPQGNSRVPPRGNSRVPARGNSRGNPRGNLQGDSRARNLDRPDWIVFDLDPGDGVEFAAICEIALHLKKVIGRAGLECFAKTSGSRGMHVYAPLKADYGYEAVAGFAERIASVVAGDRPDLATVERSLKKRPRGKIYVDFLQNARGKSVAAPYSARPRPGATVSAPLDWAEVRRGKITPQDFTIENLLKRIERKGDLFEPVLKLKQRLKEGAL
jgi:bifunctional non-homologous end joining protein LigD